MNSLLKMVIPVFTTLMSLVWLYSGIFIYGVWDAKKGPLGGFFPGIVAGVMLLVSLLALFQANKEKLPAFKKDGFIHVGAVILIFAACFVFGMLPTLAIFMVAWLRWFEKYPWKTTLTVSGIIMAVVVGVFVLWLEVMFPQGMLLDALIGR